MVMEGPAADHLQHCIVPQDVPEQSASIILRMLNPHQMQSTQHVQTKAALETVDQL